MAGENLGFGIILETEFKGAAETTRAKSALEGMADAAKAKVLELNGVLENTVRMLGQIAGKKLGSGFSGGAGVGGAGAAAKATEQAQKKHKERMISLRREFVRESRILRALQGYIDDDELKGKRRTIKAAEDLMHRQARFENQTFNARLANQKRFGAAWAREIDRQIAAQKRSSDQSFKALAQYRAKNPTGTPNPDTAKVDVAAGTSWFYRFSSFAGQILRSLHFIQFAANAVILPFKLMYQAGAWAFQQLVRGAQMLWGALQKVGMAATAAFGAFVAFGVKAVSAFAEFEQTIKNSATMTGLLGKELNAAEGELAKLALTMGPTAKSATEIAGSFYEMASAGFKVNEIAQMAPGILALADASMSDLGTTTELVTSTMLTFGLGLDQTNRVVNEMMAAVADSPETIKRLGEGMKYAGPYAAAFGMSLEETTAALMLLEKHGIRGAMAGTALRGILTKEEVETKAATAALAKYGMTMADVDTSAIGFAKSLENIGRMDPKDIAKLFAQRAGAGALVLAKEGPAAFTALTQSITGTNRAFDLQREQLNTTAGAWKMLKNEVGKAQIAFGYGAKGGVVSFIQTLFGAVNKGISGGAMNALGRLFGSLAQGAGIGIARLAQQLPNATAWFERLASKAAAWVETLPEKVNRAATRIEAWIGALLPLARDLEDRILAWAGTKGGQAGEWIDKMVAGAQYAYQVIMPALGDLAKGAREFWEALKGHFGGGAKGGVDFLAGLLTNLGQVMQQLAGNVKGGPLGDLIESMKKAAGAISEKLPELARTLQDDMAPAIKTLAYAVKDLGERIQHALDLFKGLQVASPAAWPGLAKELWQDVSTPMGARKEAKETQNWMEAQGKGIAAPVTPENKFTKPRPVDHRNWWQKLWGQEAQAAAPLKTAGLVMPVRSAGFTSIGGGLEMETQKTGLFGSLPLFTKVFGAETNRATNAGLGGPVGYAPGSGRTGVPMNLYPWIKRGLSFEQTGLPASAREQWYSQAAKYENLIGGQFNAMVSGTQKQQVSPGWEDRSGGMWSPPAIPGLPSLNTEVEGGYSPGFMGQGTGWGAFPGATTPQPNSPALPGYGTPIYMTLYINDLNQVGAVVQGALRDQRQQQRLDLVR